MALSAKSLKLIIKTLAKRLLTDKNSIIRIKAAQSLAKLESEQAIYPLCQALNIEDDINVVSAIIDAIDAIVIIDKLTSLSAMSDTPKYDLRGANIANFAETVQGEQKAVQHNYATPQNLTEAAQEIQQLITQFSATYPTNTEAEKQIFVAQVEEEIKSNSRLRSILIAGGIELIKILCPPLGIPIEMGRKWLETAQGIGSS